MRLENQTVIFCSFVHTHLIYDADGYLTSDGRWTYTWNGENRLVRAVEAAHPTNRAPRVVEYAYDHRGRMVWKTIGETNGPPDTALAYVWDDYNIVRERKNGENTYNIWGLDLDGTMQGCGGVGGLLAVVKNGEVYTPTYDANGNISEYMDSSGTIITHQEYDPFGNAVVSSGGAAFTHWFSTKPWCPVTGMVEYQFRKYRPGMGRWMSRDSIEETGGIHLSLSFHNNPVNSFDYLGMSVLSDVGDFLLNNRMADYLVCLGTCIEDNDPLSSLAEKLISAIAGMPIPKQIVVRLAEMVGEDRLANSIKASLASGGKSPYTVMPQVLAKAIRAHTGDYVFARNLLRTVGKGASVFWHAYGIYMASIESQCAIKCSTCMIYDFTGVPVSIDNLFQLLMNSFTNMQTEGKDD